DGIPGPVRLEVDAVVVAEGDEQDCGLQDLKNNIGEEPRENSVLFAMNHISKQHDLESRANKPTEIHEPVHRVGTKVESIPLPRRPLQYQSCGTVLLPMRSPYLVG